MELNIRWDEVSQAQFMVFERNGDREVGDAVWNIVQDAGEASVSFMRPLMVGNGTWGPSSGRLAQSLRFNVSANGNKYTVNFYADAQSQDNKFYQQYMDVGNFPSFMVITPAFGKKKGESSAKLFPVGARSGNVVARLPFIHGMGNTSPDSPRQFSDKAVEHMKTEIGKIADKRMQQMLDRVVVAK